MNSHLNKPTVPDQIHSRYLKVNLRIPFVHEQIHFLIKLQYMMPGAQSYQFPSTFGTNVPFGKTMFNNQSDFASLPPAVNLTNNLTQRTDSHELLDGLEQRR